MRSLRILRGDLTPEVNREVVPRATHASTAVKPGDVIELVHLVGGG